MCLFREIYCIAKYDKASYTLATTAQSWVSQSRRAKLILPDRYLGRYKHACKGQPIIAAIGFDEGYIIDTD